jgi:hypothetical protein
LLRLFTGPVAFDGGRKVAEDREGEEDEEGGDDEDEEMEVGGDEI